MNVICIGHAIKEVITARECLDAMVRGANRAGSKIAAKFLISDGGDGFLEAMQQVCDGKIVEVPTLDIFGQPGMAPVLWNEREGMAVIEVAKCLGLAQVPEERRDVMRSGSAGLADLVYWAKNDRVRKLIIGLGGSATCDGGIGFLARLQALIEDKTSQKVYVANDLMDGFDLNLQVIRDELAPMQIVVCVDVESPLLGDRGAARRFAPQKGAGEDEVEILERGMHIWAGIVENYTGHLWKNQPGAGAAGGLGFALMASNAQVRHGARWLAQQLPISQSIECDNVVLTAEGKFDRTSFDGKAPWIVAELALKKDAKPVILCGIGDQTSIQRARDKGIEIREFGRNIPLEALKEVTASKIADSACEVLRHLAQQEFAV